MKNITHRERNALRNLGQRVAYELQLDQIAGQTDDPMEDFNKHLDAVRAVEAIDIICGKASDRDYEALRWSASDSITRIKETEDGEQKVADAIRTASRQEGEI